MNSVQFAAVHKALFSIQIVALILNGLGDGDTSVDPGVVDWLGDRLDEYREEIDTVLRAGGNGGVA